MTTLFWFFVPSFDIIFLNWIPGGSWFGLTVTLFSFAHAAPPSAGYVATVATVDAPMAGRRC